jgi:hypothetical protein
MAFWYCPNSERLALLLLLLRCFACFGLIVIQLTVVDAAVVQGTGVSSSLSSTTGSYTYQLLHQRLIGKISLNSKVSPNLPFLLKFIFSLGLFACYSEIAEFA